MVRPKKTKKTSVKVGLVPMAAKPYHAGHDGLVRIAASECNEVHLFVSSADRARAGEMPIYGADMMTIWSSYIEPSLPGNVTVDYVGVPVQSVYAELESAEAAGDAETVFVIYSDKDDILKYKDTTLSKSAPSLFENGQIELRGVDRNETVNVSGTAMRNLIVQGKVKEFIALLPLAVQKNGREIYNILAAGSQKPAPKAKGKSKTATETLLRSYVKLIIS